MLHPSKHKHTVAAALVSGLAFLGLAACQPVPPAATYANGTTNNGGPTLTATAKPANNGGANLTTTTKPTTNAPTTNAPTSNAPAGYRLVGGDEFNGTSLDTSKWSAYHNTYGDGNNELACLQPQNVTESGGSMRIIAHRETVACPGQAGRRLHLGLHRLP